jgi:hypothetical protein
MAWQPAFQSGSLEGYTDLMDDCATQLAQVRHATGRFPPSTAQGWMSHSSGERDVTCHTLACGTAALRHDFHDGFVRGPDRQTVCHLLRVAACAVCVSLCVCGGGVLVCGVCVCVCVCWCVCVLGCVWNTRH